MMYAHKGKNSLKIVVFPSHECHMTIDCKLHAYRLKNHGPSWSDVGPRYPALGLDKRQQSACHRRPNRVRRRRQTAITSPPSILDWLLE